MTPVERVERMLSMEARMPQKDAAGIFIPSGMDASVKVKVMEDVLKIMREKKQDDRGY
jgi:hypothetical protein